MKSSEQTNEIATALAAFQGEIGTVTKDGYNPYFKSRYSTFGICRQTAGPALAKHGLSVVQGQMTDLEKIQVGVTTRLLHKSGQWFENEVWVKPAKDCSPQNVSAAGSYMRRTEYCAMIGLVADDDDDGEATADHSVPTYNPGLPGARESLLEAMKRVKIDDLAQRQKAAIWVEAEKVPMNELEAALRHWLKEVFKP